MWGTRQQKQQQQQQQQQQNSFTSGFNSIREDKSFEPSLRK